MKVLFFTNENFPSNRPMISQLWNRNMTSLGNSIVYIMKGKSKTIVSMYWERNKIFIFPKFRNRIVEFFIGNPSYLFFLFIIGLFSKYDILHVHNGASEGFIASILKKIRRIKFSYTYTFPFIMSLHIKIQNSSLLLRLYYKILIFFFKQSLKISDTVLPISDYLKMMLTERFNILPSKQFIVSEAASDHFLNYRNENISSNGTLKMAYVGSLGKVRNPEFLISVFESVAENIKDVEFIILGWADKPSEYEYFINLIKNSSRNKQIKFLGKLPYEDVPRVISSCNIGVSPIIPKEIYIVSTPTKCIEYLALGIPVVANIEIPDQKFILESSKGGLLAKYEIDDFAEKIVYLLKRKDLRISCGINGRQWIIENRTFEKISNVLNEHLKNVIRK